MKCVKTVRVVTVALLSAALLSGCAASMSGSAYTREQARQVQDVHTGVVQSVRNVQIEGTKSNVGTMGGAALGGLAGSNVGGGKGQIAGAIGGAILGGVAGAAAEEGITRRPGVEIVVRLDSGRMMAVTQEADEYFNPGERVSILIGYDGTARVAH